MSDASIFINYSRRDASGDAGRMLDSLRDLFDNRYFFLDVDQIQDGDNFPPVLKKSIEDCTVFIVVIGPRWLQMFRKTEERGEVNWVRTEIALALKKKKFILPVLVSEARMPLANQLPDDIKELAAINAAELSHKRWTYDIERIAKTINRKGVPLIKETKQWERKSFYAWLVIIAVILAGAIFISQKFGSKDEPKPQSGRVAGRTIPYLIEGIWEPFPKPKTDVHYSIVYAENRVVVEQFTNGNRTNTGYGTLAGKQLNVRFSGRPARSFKFKLSDDQQTLTGSQFLVKINDTTSAGIPVTWKKTKARVR